MTTRSAKGARRSAIVSSVVYLTWLAVQSLQFLVLCPPGGILMIVRMIGAAFMSTMSVSGRWL